MEQLEDDKYYRHCTYIFIPFQYLSVVFGAYLFTASQSRITPIVRPAASLADIEANTRLPSGATS